MLSKIRVKICGITTKQDMDAIIKYDAYYAGLMFFKKSPRFVDTKLARQLSLHAGNKIKNCLLYTSPSPRDAHESRMPSSA